MTCPFHARCAHPCPIAAAVLDELAAEPRLVTHAGYGRQPGKSGRAVARATPSRSGRWRPIVRSASR